MDDLTYTLRALCQRNRDGSHATQADRLRMLTLASRLGDSIERVCDPHVSMSLALQQAFGLR